MLLIFYFFGSWHSFADLAVDESPILTEFGINVVFEKYTLTRVVFYRHSSMLTGWKLPLKSGRTYFVKYLENTVFLNWWNLLLVLLVFYLLLVLLVVFNDEFNGVYYLPKNV